MENTAEISEKVALHKIFNHLADRVYCIGETTGNRNNEAKAEFDAAAEKIQHYFESHKEINPDLKKEAFFMAAAVGDEKIITIFLKDDCDVNERNKNGETPAMMAAFHGNVSTLKALLDHGADIHAQSHDHLSLEQYASKVMNMIHDNDPGAIGVMGVAVLAAARYPQGDPFVKCLELIRAKKQSPLISFFQEKYVMLSIIVLLITCYILFKRFKRAR